MKIFNTFFLLLILLNLSAQPWTTDSVLSTGHAFGDNRGFGYTVDISGDWAVVGSQWTQVQQHIGYLYGSAFVYHREVDSSWVLHQELLGDSQDIHAYFGIGVAIDSNYIAVSAGGEKAFYIFKNIAGTWIKTKKIDFNFGFRDSKLDLKGDYLLFGSNDFAGYDFNGIYIYKRSDEDWTEVQTIRAEPNYGRPLVGSFAFNGDELVVTADNQTVYLYQKNGDTLEYNSEILSPEPANRIEFGKFLEMNHNVIVITDNMNGTDLDNNYTGNPDDVAAGSAYVYVKNGSTWEFQQKLRAPAVFGNRNGDKLGESVAVNDHSIVLGATCPSNLEGKKGYVCIFGNHEGTWEFVQKIEAPDEYTNSYYFGVSCALEKNDLIIGGCDTHTGSTVSQGVSLIYQVTPEIEVSVNGYVLENGSNIDLASGNIQNFQLKLKNIGEGFLELTGNPALVKITGDNVFSVTSQPVSNSLMHGESAQCEIQYNPLQGNEFTSTIEISFNNDNFFSYNFFSNSYTAPFNGLEFNPFFLGDDFFEILNSNTLDFTDNFSVELWVKNYAINNLQTIISKAEPATGGFAIGTENALPVFEVWDLSGNHHKITGIQLLDEYRWYHFALVVENGVLKGYLNGEKINEINIGTTLGTTTNELIAGKNSWDSVSSNQFSGMADEIRIWNKALSQSEIIDNIDNELVGNESGLMVYHNCNFNNSTIIFDNAGFDNNGVIKELASWWSSNALTIPVISNATNITDISFTANWQTPETDTISEYLLDVSETADFSTFLTGYEAKIVTANSETIENLIADTTYYYRVRANIYDTFFYAEVGAYSKTAKVRTLNECIIPEKPETPTGTELLCENPANQDYTTAGSTNATSYSWEISPSNAGTITGTGTTASVDFEDTFIGNVKIKVSGQNVCGKGSMSDSLVVTITSCTTISKVNRKNPVSIFPNPSTGKFAIKFEDNSIKEFDILNSFGQLILTKKANHNITTIEIENKGLYLLRFYSEKEIFITKMLIK